MSKLITPSLVSSVEWLQKCPATWKEKAFQDLRSSLARDYSQPIADYVKKGIDFENMLYRVCNEIQGESNIDNLKCSEEFKEVVRACYGGKFQAKSKSIIFIDGIEYCLYGKIDVMFPDKIIDIKFTEKNPSDVHPNKYLDTIQHLIYCYNENIKNFEYLVCFGDKENGRLKSSAVFSYLMEDRQQTRELIENKVRSVIEFLEMDNELKDLYEHKFNMY